MSINCQTTGVKAYKGGTLNTMTGNGIGVEVMIFGPITNQFYALGLEAEISSFRELSGVFSHAKLAQPAVAGAEIYTAYTFEKNFLELDKQHNKRIEQRKSLND